MCLVKSRAMRGCFYPSVPVDGDNAVLSPRPPRTEAAGVQVQEALRPRLHDSRRVEKSLQACRRRAVRLVLHSAMRLLVHDTQGYTSCCCIPGAMINSILFHFRFSF